MSYAVKEIFLTLQGEGVHAGRRSVFVRFAGCNLWSGLERDRATAVCQFCDTDFVGMDGEGGGRFATATDLAQAAAETWGSGRDSRFVVLTGGEPMLQVDADLIDALHAEGFFIAIESNGTLAVPRAIDWICISPKARSETVQRRAIGCQFPLVGQLAHQPRQLIDEVRPLRAAFGKGNNSSGKHDDEDRGSEAERTERKVAVRNPAR